MKKLFITTLFLGAFFVLEAQNKDLSFNFEPYTDLTFGKTGEYLYNLSGSRVLSYLNYGEVGLVSFGLKSQLQYRESTLILDGKYKIPQKCGTMTDSDWKIKDIKTNYGIFENYTNNQNFQFTLEYQYKFDLTEHFKISPAVQFDYDHKSFNCKNGYGYYPDSYSWEEDKAAGKTVKLSHIDYLYQGYYLFTGGVFTLDYSKIKVNFLAYTAPLRVSYAIDYHGDDNPQGTQDYTTCYKQTSLFMAYKLKLDAEFVISPRTSIRTGLSSTLAPLTKGPVGYYKGQINEKCGLTQNTSRWNVIGQPGGSDVYEVSAAVGLKIKF